MILTDSSARNAKKRSCVSVFFAFFCGSHLWLRRKPRWVYPCPSVVKKLCALAFLLFNFRGQNPALAEACRLV
jgi:hypothetical protein